MCRLCSKTDTLYICINCVKNSLKTTRGRNLMRRLIVDSTDQLKNKLKYISSGIFFVKIITKDIKKLYLELDCYISSITYLQYFINRLDYSTTFQSEYLPVNFIKPNWLQTCSTVEQVRQLLIVLTKHSPRLLNHIGKDLKEINEYARIILTGLKIIPTVADRALLFKKDIIKISCSPVRDFESPWRGKPLPINYQETSDDDNWNPFFEDLPSETSYIFI